MTLNLSLPNSPYEIKPRITVIGVGGAGGNAVNNMIRAGLEGVDFLVANTDAQALSQSLCERRIQLGASLTQGLGAGSRPDVGRAATEEALDQIVEALQGANMLFITAGMGGGTGTGSAPVLARVAREHGILTVGVVTKPFTFEGMHRMRIAEGGIQELQQYVDTLIIIPNQNLFRVANEKTTFADAFNMADDVLHSGVRGVTDLMVMPGLINLDFADIRSVMGEMGKAMMGTGEADGEDRSRAAAEAAISNPLLDDVSMKGARGVLINITGGMDMTLFEVDEAANRIRDEVDPEANIIFGSTFDKNLEGRIRISVVATGIDAEAATYPRPVPLTLVGKGGRVMSAPAAAAHGGPATATPAAAYAPEPAIGAAALAMAYYPAAQVGPGVRIHDDRQATGAPMFAPRASAQDRPARTEPWQPPAPETILPPGAPASATPGRPAAQQPRRTHNPLFGRATGATAWPRPEAPRPAAPTPQPAAAQPVPAQPAGPPEPAPAEAPAQAAPALPAAPTQPAASQPPRPAQPSPPAMQPRLAGLDPQDRLGALRAEEDLLDIPAFLRRQAN